jgi:hypothetical protein
LLVLVKEHVKGMIYMQKWKNQKIDATLKIQK